MNNLAETKANMHYGLKVCYIVENMGIKLREQEEIPVTNSLYRFAYEEEIRKAAEEAPVQQGDKVSEPAPAHAPITKNKRTQIKRVPKPKTSKAQPSGDKVSEGVVTTSRQAQKAPIYVSNLVPELSMDDHNQIDESVPNVDSSSDSKDDIPLQEALKRSRIETHGGASRSAPLRKRAKTHQSEDITPQ